MMHIQPGLGLTPQIPILNDILSDKIFTNWHCTPLPTADRRVSQIEADAIDWAQRNGITQNDLQKILATVVRGSRNLEIRPDQISIGRQIDKGSYGSISLAEFNATNVEAN